MHLQNSTIENSSLATPTNENDKEVLLPQLQGNIYANSFTEFSRQQKESTKRQLQYVLGIPIIFAIIPAYYGGVQFSYPDYNALAQKPADHNPMNYFPESHPNANFQQQQQAVNTQQLSSTTNDPTYDIDIRNIGEHSISEQQHLTLQPTKAILNNDKMENDSFYPTIGEQVSSNDFIIHFDKDVNIGTGQISKPAGGKRIVDFRIEETVTRPKDNLALVAGSDDAIHFIENGTEQGDITSPLEIITRRRIEGLPIEDEEPDDGSGVDDRINSQVIKTLVG